MVIPILILLAIAIVLVLAWTGKSAFRNNRGDSSVPYSGDTTAPGHLHSDHCGHGYDGGVGGGGGDCGGGDGGGGGSD
jgi:hypothetical protein